MVGSRTERTSLAQSVIERTLSERAVSLLTSMAWCASLALVLALALSQFSLANAQTAAPGGGPQSSNIFDVQKETEAQRHLRQPLNNAPVWRAVNSNEAHTTTLPANEGGVLIQSAGEDWRNLRNGPISQYSGWIIVAALVVVLIFYLVRGTMRVHGQPTGKLIERFTFVERAAHWTTAITFVTLALTGLLLLLGKYFVLPVFGYAAFSTIAIVCKSLHNFLGPLFSLAIVITFILFVKDNFPKSHDLTWMARLGGLFSRKAHIPSGRFNAGEKVWFWGGLTLLGLIMTITGFILDFPNFQQTRGQMQLAWTWHVIAAVLFILGSIGHIYMGTLGMAGAFKAMKTGYVDEAWAKEHHEYWYDDVKSGRIPAQRTRRASDGGARTDPARRQPV